MRYEPDLTIRGADGSLVAVIEVLGVSPQPAEPALSEASVPILEAEGFEEPSAELAKGIFDNYRAAVGGVPPQYFLVISPRKGFLWKKDALQPDDSANLELDMGPVFLEYLDPEKDSPRIRGFRYVLFRWLFGIASGIRTPDTDAEGQLRGIGFTDAIQDAHVSFGLAA